ncbi:MAG TPA: Gmad2 immunoglobulin-like domain-containing protein [Nocardioides sp.]|jgi:hypothetical protein|nr:Gmad2 immunoglobulin-like domain-containing protein [Nocardioides sp.]
MNDDERLRHLLSDAVSDVEPQDRLGEIRASVRPRPKVVPMARSRSWYAVSGIVATAAVIGVVAYLTSVAGDDPQVLGPADGGSGTSLPHDSTATATDSSAPQPSTSAAPQVAAVNVFYLGDGPSGDVLYREQVPVSPDVKALDSAVSALASDPFDADYRTPWAPGWLVSATVEAGVIRVDLGSVPARRPAAMSARTAYETVQSAVYTFQAATHSHDPVRFTRTGKSVPTVLGVPTDQPVTAGRVTDVLSRMIITSPPLDALHIRRGRLTVTGLNNGFEATVVVQLKRGDHVYRTKSGMASGWTGDRLYPWRVALDTSRLQPGRYVLVASNDDPSGKGNPDHDTRVVFLK